MIVLTGVGCGRVAREAGVTAVTFVVVLALLSLLTGGLYWLYGHATQRSARSALETRAMLHVRFINSAQSAFAASCSEGRYAIDLATLLERAEGIRFLEEQPPDPREGAYEYQIVPLEPGTSATCLGTRPVASGYAVFAVPLLPEMRHFASTHANVIFTSKVPITIQPDGMAAPPARILH